MALPSIENHPLAQRVFVSAIMAGYGPCTAVLKAHAAGAQVSEEWLRSRGYLPVHARIDELIKRNATEEAGFFRAQNIEAWGHEHRAIALIRARVDVVERDSVDDRARKLAEENEARRLERRESEAAMRGAEAMQRWLDDKKAEFVEQARREFDATNPPIKYEPAAEPARPTRAKRSA